MMSSVLVGRQQHELSLVFTDLLCDLMHPARYIRDAVLEAKYGILDGIHIFVAVYIYVCIINITVVDYIVLSDDC